jgi:hypothetical protein
MLALRLAVACWCAAAAAVYTCTNADDCELLGTCVDGACVCAAGFTGPSCGVLALAPAQRATMAQWPVATEIAAGTVSGWGFSPVYDTADGKWHAVACTACDWDGVLKPGGGTSITVHLVSDAPDAGWALVAMFTPPTTFNPTLLRTPDGYALYFRANELNLTALCGGNGSDPSPGLLAGAYVPASALTPDPTGEGATNIYVAAAANMYGPWTVSRVNISGAGTVHKSNPSVAALADGRYVMAYRYNPPGGERNAVAIADDFRGPFVNVANVTEGVPHGNNEDPFIWQADDGSVHMLSHNGPVGYHAFSRNGTVWRTSPIGAQAFSVAVDVDDGSKLVLHRRERPFLTFASPTRPFGAPTFLFNGVQVADANGSAFSFTQPFL